MAKYLSCGKFDKPIKYILYSVLFSCISTFLFGYGYCNESHSIHIAQLYKGETYTTQESLSTHVIIHNIYRHFFILIISIILYNYEKYSTKSQKIEELVTKINTKLIYENLEETLERKTILYIIITMILFNIHDILTVFYFTFDLSYLDLFILELPLFAYFNYKILNTKIYSHHKCSMYSSVAVCLTTKISSLFVYAFSEEHKNEIYNQHKFLYFVGISSYLLIIILRAYCVSVIKLFIDIRYISPNKILIFYGAIGIVINVAIMLLFSYNKCATVNDIDIHLCNVVEDNLNREEAYFENIFIYFQTLKDSINVGRSYEVIIEVVISFFGSIAQFCNVYFYFLVIKYLTTIHIIFQSFTYSFSVRVLTILIQLINNTYFNQSDFNISEFFIALISDGYAGVSIFVYLELIELNFCNLNYNLRRHIMTRSEEELIIKKPKKDLSILSDDKESEDPDSNLISQELELSVSFEK